MGLLPPPEPGSLLKGIKPVTPKGKTVKADTRTEKTAAEKTAAEQTSSEDADEPPQGDSA